MKKDQNSKTEQEFENQLNDLADKAKKIAEELDITSKRMRKNMDNLNAKIGISIKNIEQTCSELDQADKEASAELDKLTLQYAEDLDDLDAEDLADLSKE